jgi:hypothetical protein
MDSNGFFRILNRVNAILFALAGLAILLFIFGNTLQSMLFGMENNVAVVPHAGENSDVSYEFGNLDNVTDNGASGTMSVLTGTNDAMMVLKRGGKQQYGSFSGSGGREEISVNILIVDTETAKSRWLFPGVKRAIGSSFLVRAIGPSKTLSDNPVTALLMSVADRDTDGNGTIDSSDAESLYIYKPGTLSAVKLLDARAISNIVQIDSGKFLVTYYDGKSDRVVIYAVDGFKPLAQGVVAPTPDK